MLLENRNVGIAIGVMSLRPMRKKLCLVIEEGNRTVKVASFNNDEAAMYFMEKFKKFAEVPDANG